VGDALLSSYDAFVVVIIIIIIIWGGGGGELSPTFLPSFLPSEVERDPTTIVG
jgi:hypothetical protein